MIEFTHYFKVSIFSVLLVSCINDIEPEIPNEEELITTMELHFTPENGGDSKQFLFQDIDGDGGNEPLIVGDTLEANTRYLVSVFLYNEQYTPTLNITEEVEEEGAEHQFFYQSENQSLTFEYNDSDENGDPIGLYFICETSTTTEEVLTVTLRHEPDKNGLNVAEGNIENAGGETDIQVNFPCYVQ